MNYKKGYGSQLWISFSFGVYKPVFNVITLLFLWFPFLYVNCIRVKGFLQD